MARSTMTRTRRPSPAESIQSRLDQILRPPHRLHPEAFVRQIEEVLECLPMATAEYDLAKARIRNARRYLLAGENGAAGYEIQLLIGLLNKFVD